MLDHYAGLIAMLSPVVAAYVGIAKEFKVDPRYNHLIALGIAAVFVLVPEAIQIKLTVISMIGLAASGLYHFTKKREAEGNGKRS